MNEEDFKPEDMKEIEMAFAKTISNSKVGYIVEFHISRLAAEEMTAEWIQALMGDADAIRACMQNYSFIVQQIMDELKLDSE